jgi:hypothetical protein
MTDKRVGNKGIVYLDSLVEAGAFVNAKGSVQINPDVRTLVSKLHSTLTGSRDVEMFNDLEGKFQEALEEAQENLATDPQAFAP